VGGAGKVRAAGAVEVDDGGEVGEVEASEEVADSESRGDTTGAGY